MHPDVDPSKSQQFTLVTAAWNALKGEEYTVLAYALRVRLGCMSRSETARDCARCPGRDVFDTNPQVSYEHTAAVTWNASITAAEDRRNESFAGRKPRARGERLPPARADAISGSRLQRVAAASRCSTQPPRRAARTECRGGHLAAQAGHRDMHRCPA